ncbi:MAG: hypothetical protein ACPG5L_03700 [Vibrio gallaecicus]|uniref:hypothetical protein n=1 Tax=Vibrio TaxID=662 RepID=UPI0010C9913A|nr:hypothetical protein [Vibrio gallaecicus]MDN3616781.1 hypothetical protein [Vibrio gallaecicus]
MRHQNNPDLQLWLREAKGLQKLAQSASLAHSLPVLRRLLNSKVLTNTSLVELKSNTKIIQRKHLLQMLAAENGAKCWAEFKQHIITAPEGSILPNSIELRDAGYPILWFANAADATLYADNHGGKVVKVGTQAAVAPQQWER